MPSPFLTPGTHSQLDSLALLHLRRDQTLPAILQHTSATETGYKEGKVTNTRFGSFPHSTLVNKPWGSQIAASKVDTGSRGRRPSKKRKASDLAADSTEVTDSSAPVTAASGYLHLLAPTPELWTASLPHRTQVVYTPDYSYILHRLRARPGSTVIEAGAGSGSFTHASVRAVFSGYPTTEGQTEKRTRRLGKVCSFEFHAQRAERVREEVHQHGLDGLVEVTHRDVYADGFLVGDAKTGTSPKANAVFLDLPAPWLALKHLVRGGEASPLDPSSPVYICTFSPCLEQVERTISELRQMGWLGIEMVEVNNRRIDVNRMRVGLQYEGVRGAVVAPRTVEESVTRMRMLEKRAREFRARQEENNINDEGEAKPSIGEAEKSSQDAEVDAPPLAPESDVPIYRQGRLVHRTELDLKTHTSYLVFAVLPREWTEEDEQRCRAQWPSNRVEERVNPKGKRQLKREAEQKEREEEEERDAQKDAS
ncbi:tRNA (adenine-N(1)-)-methyltransferase catalytic subunit trm61 [Aspergillus nanangensis]|uniref:tRNA (adenine(58)-N(1))-methyltransferase catalytic subunit TRM61 n=1 Tax=Aspergillus nanangensis TaxID=2582783 RepID=A0AAD4CYM2_ASPNN|nr:tRNA (adenine-N(1)-)-methyltransferase catalytic subunit trm61 [Aspergillus nanangensis]